MRKQVLQLSDESQVEHIQQELYGGQISETIIKVIHTDLKERNEDLRNQGIASNPIAKKKLNANNIIEATIPAEAEPSDTVPARIAIQQPCPAAAKSISFRLPSLSMTQIGMSELRK